MTTDNESASPAAAEPAVFWARVREHKIIQWALGYLGAALALAHGAERVGHAFEWPEIVNRVLMIVLVFRSRSQSRGITATAA